MKSTFILSWIGVILNILYYMYWEELAMDNGPGIIIIGSIILLGFTVGMFWYWISLYLKNKKQ